MPKWDKSNAPAGRRFHQYKKFKRRSDYHKPRQLCNRFPDGINHTFRLHEKKEMSLSKIPDDEREFFREWVFSRHIEEQYLLLALSYWMRIRSGLVIMFLVKDKRMYMIACIHTALKWLGYDEVYKCNFIQDFREIGSINPQQHAELEFEILRELSWEL